MTPEQKIKVTIMLRCQAFTDHLGDPPIIASEEVDTLWGLYREDFGRDPDTLERSQAAPVWCSQDDIVVAPL